MYLWWPSNSRVSSFSQRLQPIQPSNAVFVRVLQRSLRYDFIQAEADLTVLLEEQALARRLLAHIFNRRRDGVEHLHERQLVVQVLPDREHTDVAGHSVDDKYGLMRRHKNLVIPCRLQILTHKLHQERSPVQPLLRRQPVEPLQQNIAGPIGEQYTKNHGDSNAARDAQPQSWRNEARNARPTLAPVFLNQRRRASRIRVSTHYYLGSFDNNWYIIFRNAEKKN